MVFFNLSGDGALNVKANVIFMLREAELSFVLFKVISPDARFLNELHWIKDRL
jgi:hypothetical protein